jgi:hypothetical protein
MLTSSEAKAGSERALTKVAMPSVFMVFMSILLC